MGRSYSLDLRKRVVDRVAAGQSRRAAADELDVMCGRRPRGKR